MNCTEVQGRLNELVDGELAEDLRVAIDRHLEVCDGCKTELDNLRRLVSDVRSLPESITPHRDLWPSIKPRLRPRTVWQWGNVFRFSLFSNHRSAPTHSTGRNLPAAWYHRKSGSGFKLGLAAGLASLIIVGVWVLRTPSSSGWEVERVSGVPMVGSLELQDHGHIRIGQSLETDAESRATITLGLIGKVAVEPNSRVRLLDTDADDHRLALDRGVIHASVTAPPRIFSVETPSATAVDLGCEYRLAVDGDGGATLLVTAGYVALEWWNRQSIVPAASLCITRPGFGPGTPYSEFASELLREALVQFDFGKEKERALEIILSSAERHDAVTLWHLLSRVDFSQRDDVYEKFASVLPPPQGVTRDGILSLDPRMMDAWWEEFAPLPPGVRSTSSDWGSILKAIRTRLPI